MEHTRNRRCVVIGGAPIQDYDFVKGFLREDDFFIFCDCGLRHMQKLRDAAGSDARVQPDLIVGDFDSYENPGMTDVETIVLPTVKDETDTAFAVSEALRRGFKDYLIIGAVGGRMDHTLVNISLLLKLYEAGCEACLVDDYSEMSIAGPEPAYVDDSYKYFSLFNMFGPSSDITITGAKYELSGAEIKADRQYATSNEVAKGDTACITVGNGKLLLMKVCREIIKD